MSKSANAPKQPLPPAMDESTLPAAAWKQEVNQRLAAHRTRRGGQEAAGQPVAENARPATGRAAEAAARVAARYAKAPSYSQLLAGEARAAVRAAGAAAEAAFHAQAAAEAVLAGLESSRFLPGEWTPAYDAPPGAAPESHPFAQAPGPPEAHLVPPRWLDSPPDAAPPDAAPPARETPPAAAMPRWEETMAAPEPDVWAEMRVYPAAHPAEDFRREPEQRLSYGQRTDEAEWFPWEEAVDPVGSATVEPIQHLPANLIEFPRELVAARKARPRLAEGPYYDAAHDGAQLNIFEVDPQTPAGQAAPGEISAPAIAPPEWASIELDHQPEPEFEPAGSGQTFARAAAVDSARFPGPGVLEGGAVVADPAAASIVAASAPSVSPGISAPRAVPLPSAPARTAPVELLVARVSDRLLAAVVDGALVTLAFLAAAVVVIAATAHPPAGRIALVASGCGVLLFGLLYQFLFLSYAEEGTPGMRYARIALCTFDDDNPTRNQMRMRIPALMLSALPAGLGLIWAIFDRDHLAWHDRLTRTYQRKY